MLSVESVWGLHTTLARNITKTDTQIQVPMNTGHLFKGADAGHFYMTVRNGTVREVVKVVGRMGDTFTVERGMDNTTPQTFPRGSCLDVEWVPTQLCEFVNNCIKGDRDKIKAGTVCISCDTCLEVDAGGHIVAINGAKEC